jgi:hypothetical protein
MARSPDSNAARRKSPIRQLQALIDSGSLSPNEQLQAIKRLASLKAAKAKDRKAKAAERQQRQEKQPREWHPVNRGTEALYHRHIREGRFEGSLREWLDLLRSCTFGHEREGQDFYKVLAEVMAAKPKEQE